MSKMELLLQAAGDPADSVSSFLENLYRHYAARAAGGGASRDRTDDLKLAKLALSQLSYGPARMFPMFTLVRDVCT